MQSVLIIKLTATKIESTYVRLWSIDLRIIHESVSNLKSNNLRCIRAAKAAPNVYRFMNAEAINNPRLNHSSSLCKGHSPLLIHGHPRRTGEIS